MGANMNNLRGYIIKNLFDFDDELNPRVSPFDIVWPISVLDAIIDQNSDGPEKITLRQILARMQKQMDQGAEELNIEFPVTSVATKIGSNPAVKQLGDVVITKDLLGLDKVENFSLTDISTSIMTSVQVITNAHNTRITKLETDTAAHYINYTNPHKVTLTQAITADSAGYNTYVTVPISNHNVSVTAHTDIRSLIAIEKGRIDALQLLWDNAFGAGSPGNIPGVIADLRNDLDNHRGVGGDVDHIQKFATKEDHVKKQDVIVSEFTRNAAFPTIVGLDPGMYPSTIGMRDYIEARLDRFREDGELIAMINALSGVLINNAITAHNASPIAHPHIQARIDILEKINPNHFWRDPANQQQLTLHAITNAIMAIMPPNTLKGNLMGTSTQPQDITLVSLVAALGGLAEFITLIQEISGMNLKIIVVDRIDDDPLVCLPSVSIADRKAMYFLQAVDYDNEPLDNYDVYVVLEDEYNNLYWEKINNTRVDLADYLKIVDLYTAMSPLMVPISSAHIQSKIPVPA